MVSVRELLKINVTRHSSAGPPKVSGPLVRGPCAVLGAVFLGPLCWISYLTHLGGSARVSEGKEKEQ